MTNLNLFVYTSPAALTDVSLIPPPIVVNPTLFQYTIRLSDGAIAAAPLNTLVRVAEPSTPWLLGLGLSGLVWLRRRLGGAS